MIIDGKGLSDRTNGLKWMDGWMDGWLWQAMRLFMIYVFGIHKYRGLSVIYITYTYYFEAGEVTKVKRRPRIPMLQQIDY